MMHHSRAAKGQKIGNGFDGQPLPRLEKQKYGLAGAVAKSGKNPRHRLPVSREIVKILCFHN